MKMNTIIPAIAIIAIGLFLYNRNQITEFKTQKIFIQSDKVQEDLRIVQVTDFHSNSRIDIDRLKVQIQEFNPHMIAFTGDLVDHKTEDLTVALNLMDSLNSIGVPVYFVEGNHEIANRHRKELLKGLEDRNVIILKNGSQEIVVDENPIGIYGAEFYIEDHDYQEMLSSVDRDKLNILLSHSPVKSSWYADGDVDLILSGHTHGGQIRLPFIGGLVSPSQGLFPHYDKGLMELPEGTMLYIDSGIGNSVLPIRIMNPVQFSLITISSR